MKRREYFLYAKKIKRMTFIQQFVSSLSLCVTVAPFWRISAGRKVRTLFSVISNALVYALIWMETAYPCVTDDRIALVYRIEFPSPHHVSNFYMRKQNSHVRYFRKCKTLVLTMFSLCLKMTTLNTGIILHFLIRHALRRLHKAFHGNFYSLYVHYELFYYL